MLCVNHVLSIRVVCEKRSVLKIDTPLENHQPCEKGRAEQELGECSRSCQPAPPAPGRVSWLCPGPCRGPAWLLFSPAGLSRGTRGPHPAGPGAGPSPSKVLSYKGGDINARSAKTFPEGSRDEWEEKGTFQTCSGRGGLH